MRILRRAIPLLATALATAPAAATDVTIADTHVYPESLSTDRAGRIYVGSVKGIVYRSMPGGVTAEPWIRRDAENGLLAILGVLVDEPSDTLWLCSAAMPFSSPPTAGISSLKAFALKTGKLKASYPFPGPPSSCNDVTIARDGTAFATDTPNGRIFRLRRGAAALELFAQDDRLRSVDGIAFSGDGTLYVNLVSAQKMLRIDRDRGGAYKGLTELKLSQPVAGPDGLRLIAGNRFLQAEGNSGRITEVTITGDKADIRVVRDGLNSPAAVAPCGRMACTAEGKILYLVDPKLKGQDPGPFVIRAFPLGVK